MPAPATIGASISTRVSFTTTAIASAAEPAVCAVATTWPTSCTLAPTQCPNCRPVSPSGACNSGSTPMARVPQSVTSATGVACSARLLRVTDPIAPIADAPQMENPVATSRACVLGSRNSLPIQ